MRCSRLLLAWLIAIAGLTPANAAPTDEKAACSRNLRLIYDAIQNFRRQNKELPPDLPALIPRYLAIPSLLFCPAAKRQGITSAQVSGVNGNQSIQPATSYVYEFNLNPIPPVIAGGAPISMRDWKRRQMGLLGSGVPMVRCHNHGRSLNLSFGGDVYESNLDWEMNFIDVVPIEHLFFNRLFASDLVVRVVQVAPRSPETPSSCLDLSEHYNASLNPAWHPGDSRNSLAALPKGLQTFASVPFDVRGIIQLSATNPRIGFFPPSADGLPVRRSARAIHFLHATGFAEAAEKVIGQYRIRFADGQQVEFPIVYGKDVADWWQEPSALSAAKPAEPRVAWRGTNPFALANGKSICLFHSVWKNPQPDQAIDSIDFVSAMTASAPFLVAITLEE